MDGHRKLFKGLMVVAMEKHLGGMGHTSTPIDGRCGAGMSDFIEAIMIGSWELVNSFLNLIYLP